MGTDIAISYEAGNNIAFIIKCECRSMATDENIISAVERRYENIFGSAKAKMIPTLIKGHTKIEVIIPGDILKIRWTFIPSVNIIESPATEVA